MQFSYKTVTTQMKSQVTIDVPTTICIEGNRKTTSMERIISKQNYAILVLYELCNCHYCEVIKLQSSCTMVLNGCFRSWILVAHVLNEIICRLDGWRAGINFVWMSMDFGKKSHVTCSCFLVLDSYMELHLYRLYTWSSVQCSFSNVICATCPLRARGCKIHLVVSDLCN